VAENRNELVKRQPYERVRCLSPQVSTVTVVNSVCRHSTSSLDYVELLPNCPLWDQDTPPAAARTPTRDVAHPAAHRNHDTARGPGGPCSVAARWTAYANRRCAAAAVATKTNQTIPGTCRAGSVIHGAKPPGARRLTRWLLEFSNCAMTTSGNARASNGVHGNVAPSDRFR
jgi:hypothetical protein